MVKGTIGGTKITLVNLYAPNEDCPNFFKMMASLLGDKAEGTILLVTLHAMMDQMGLVDVWRHLHVREKDYTFIYALKEGHPPLVMVRRSDKCYS
uniref:Uncharacterized protein n=1 Tax=Sparus aurata TaxID=8175 RepID=A0A671TK67_SPAAU